jgi:prevent-host-death family protein
MSKAYSIAEARNQLSRVVHEAEDGGEVRLTRRGKPVAVVLSMEEFQRLQGAARRTVWSVIEEARAELSETTPAPGEFDGVRSTEPGRDVQW